MATTEQYDPQDRRRLGRLLETRRGELGYETRPAMEKAAGLNVRLIADIEKGYRGNFKPDTLGRVSRAYQVTSASITAVLRGEAAALEPAPPAEPGAPGSLTWMSGQEEHAARAHADAIWERLVALAGRGVTAPSGAEVLGAGSDDAAFWDRMARSGAWTTREMVWNIAQLRAREASGRQHGQAAG